jgi:hypothetical protein
MEEWQSQHVVAFAPRLLPSERLPAERNPTRSPERALEGTKWPVTGIGAPFGGSRDKFAVNNGSSK